MLTNRTTKIKVIENGAAVKTVPNATINFGLDHATFKKMISLAIRLSPQDPLYEVNDITLHGKTDDKDLIIEDVETEDDEVQMKTKIKKILCTLSPFEALSLSVCYLFRHFSAKLMSYFTGESHTTPGRSFGQPTSTFHSETFSTI
jgi:hypothetical protein